jgi:hypothetical protein
MMDGLLLKDFLSAHGPSCSQCLCTTWLLNPKALASLPGFCIAVHLLSVLKHGCCKAEPVCCHEHPNVVPSFYAKQLA